MSVGHVKYPIVPCLLVGIMWVTAACGADTEGVPSIVTPPSMVSAPLPPGIREIWWNQTGLLLTVDEDVWVDRLDRLCRTAVKSEKDSPAWNRDGALALADEFLAADGLRPDLQSDQRESIRWSASGTLWTMIVQPGVCWDRVPPNFLEAGWRGDRSVPPAQDVNVRQRMTDEAQAHVASRFEQSLWSVTAPLSPGLREIWWDGTGLRATVNEDKWVDRLNQACNTPADDPMWDLSAAAALAEEFVIADGGEPTADLLEAGAQALWHMTVVPPSGACPWLFSPETLNP